MAITKMTKKQVARPQVVDSLPGRRTPYVSWREVESLADANPTKWIKVKTYRNANSARVSAFQTRDRYPRLDIETRGSTLYARLAPTAARRKSKRTRAR